MLPGSLSLQGSQSVQHGLPLRGNLLLYDSMLLLGSLPLRCLLIQTSLPCLCNRSLQGRAMFQSDLLQLYDLPLQGDNTVQPSSSLQGGIPLL